MANPLKLRDAEQGSARVVAPIDKQEREAFWIERGNRILWGQEPTRKGDFLEPRHDLHWRCVNGNYFIESRSGAKA
jgi:hypothetical protein